LPFSSGPDAVVSTMFSPADVPELEQELSRAIAQINRGEFRFRARVSSRARAVLRSMSSAAGPRLRGRSGPPAREPAAAQPV